MSLWGEEFEIKDTSQEVKKILNKVNNPKTVTVSVEKALKSKKVPLSERLDLIKTNVLDILGVYVNNTLVIKTKQQFIEYIDKAIENGVIAIDTETNRSLDPLTCTLMGPCIYTPGMKNAYIPINHVDNNTGERLSWQLTESDVKEQFDRLKNVKIIYHNATFDYQVIKCTTGCKLGIYWDTMIGARILNENERAGLKGQYIQKIDPSIEKYSIEKFFSDVDYEQVDPEIFALYAATDAYMTYRLYEYQLEQFQLTGNERLFNLFKNVEVPLLEVVAEMELTGVAVDLEFNKRLSAKYHKLLEEAQTNIDKELQKLEPKIEEWRKTSEANKQTTKRTKGASQDSILGKSKSEQLQHPVNASSPLQLAILLYDVLKVPVIDKKTPRGTGVDILEKIDLPICKLILEQRAAAKLVSTFIDKIPNIVSPVDGRVHTHFNSIGADTGRMSSSEPINL